MRGHADTHFGTTFEAARDIEHGAITVQLLQSLGGVTQTRAAAG
jgi:hypothetical protein